ncbi:MAG TPA: hypothetical protein VNB22_09205 [Pyrinomonadaceae bacterium]|jgi:hypothetical protein|nr:hypothetical protein [Pyrinomonadaceae bacterium]
MKKILVLMIVCLSFQMVSAQKNASAERDRKAVLKELADIKKEQQSPVNSLLTAADVGEPDSFGKNVKFLGTATTGGVYVYRSCDPQILLDELELVLGADDRCLAHTVGGATSSATFDNLGRITIPGRSADNVVYFILNNTINNEFQNNFANGLPVTFSYIPKITIESAAFNDPSALDPTTGLPLNGVLTVSAFGAKQFIRTIPANDFEFFFDQYSAAATRGFARGYFADLGLPQTVINNLYRQPMTIRLGMRIAVRNVYFGQYLYAMRLTGN